MDTTLKHYFTERWNKYFPKAELPLVMYYTDDPGDVEHAKPSDGHRCLVGDLAKARNGTPIAFDKDSAVCPGAKRYAGFTQELMPGFEHFLSTGIPGKLEGERYKKSPELVKTYMDNQPPFIAPAEFLVFKRWDMLEAGDEPEVVVFFGTADVISGLFTLANFDAASPEAVITPFGAGCGTFIQHPYVEIGKPRPRAVLGMFDVSARPCVRPGELSFAVPMKRFTEMVNDMDESFLITPSWSKVQNRIEKGGA